VREVYLALRGRSDGVLVEGPSGLLAPIGWNRTTADLASVLGLPIVIVCRPGRGTINHAALTLEAARRRNLAVQGLIVNGASDRPGLEELANRAELARLAPILEIVPDETINSFSGG
jgi:dethiobiotin synthetase